MNDEKKPGLSVVAEAVTVTVKSDAGGAPKTLLKDISLKIEPGEFICVLGPSGAGKSTLVRAMLGETCDCCRLATRWWSRCVFQG